MGPEVRKQTGVQPDVCRHYPMLAEADENFVAARRYLAICSHSVKEVDNHASPGKVETANAQIAMFVCLRLC